MRRMLTLACALAFATLALNATGQEAADERSATYRQFRSAFDAGDYATALPLAARIVEISRNQFGAEAQELVNPLGNLATTYLRMRQYGEALDAYRSALTLLDLQGDTTDPRLVRPLHGMGAALRGLEREAEAIAPLKRAVDITRNRDGLYVVTQLPMLTALIDCYMATGRYQDAGREQQYAYTVAETAYGKDDLRLLVPLDNYARWNERVGRYTAARVLHARAVQIADAADPNGFKSTGPLRGIARTYRLAFVDGESEEAIAGVNALPPSLSSSALTRTVSAPSGEGERALRTALQRLARVPGEQAALRGEVLLDLGDWHLTAGAGARALGSYRDAWRELTVAGDTKALATPMVVSYKPPTMATARGPEDADAYAQADVELRLAISVTGEVRDATVANAAPDREAIERAVIAAVKRALWRPAFANGEPIAYTDLPFRERVWVRRPKPAN